MYPVAFRLGPLTIYSYGVAMMTGFLLATWLGCRFIEGLPKDIQGMTSEQLVDFACVVLFGGILGGRLFYVALYWREFWQQPWEIPALWHGGLVWYGGFFGGLVAGWGFVRIKRLKLFQVLDRFVPFVALGHAIGRVGCFLNGCCYGRPTTSWCGVLFPGHAERVIPTQLFEAAGLLVIYVVLRRLQQPRQLRQSGQIFARYLMWYALLRIVIEAFRGDQWRWAGLITLQQVISVGVFLIGFMLWRRRIGTSPSMI